MRPVATTAAAGSRTEAPTRAPALGFLGVGWIGLQRMQALTASGAGAVAAIADADATRARAALDLAPDAHLARSLDEILDMPLDGIVIATPSALHAEQAVRALEAGMAVFCQKPLARTAVETELVLDAARSADRLLGVDLSYRHTRAMQAVRDAVRGGDVGDVFLADLVFHNAWGPDRGWARDPALAGGGCMIDLGTHLIDLALWTLGFPPVQRAGGHLFADGRRLRDAAACEDHATAVIELEDDRVIRIACSWECSTGQDAVIEATFTGTRGAAGMRNVNGSFHDFVALLHQRNRTRTLAVPPDDWGGRALVAWSRRLARDASHDPAVETIAAVARTLDQVIGR